MGVFLILSSSGVFFYLFLLFQLYRDGRRNRNRVEFLHKIVPNRKSTTRFSSAGPSAAAGTHRPKRSDEATWLPVTKFEWKPAK